MTFRLHYNTRVISLPHWTRSCYFNPQCHCSFSLLSQQNGKWDRCANCAPEFVFWCCSLHVGALPPHPTAQTSAISECGMRLIKVACFLHHIVSSAALERDGFVFETVTSCRPSSNCDKTRHSINENTIKLGLLYIVISHHKHPKLHNVDTIHVPLKCSILKKTSWLEVHPLLT